MKNFFATLLTALIVGCIVWAMICGGIILGKLAFADTRTPIIEECGLYEAELMSIMPSELKQYAKSFLKTEKEEGINALFLLAIANIESGRGTSILAEKHGNLFGIKNGGRYIWWNDKNGLNTDRGIEHAGWFLRTRFIEKGATSIRQIGRTYSGTEEWGKAVEGEFGALSKKAYNLITSRTKCEIIEMTRFNIGGVIT